MSLFFALVAALRTPILEAVSDGTEVGWELGDRPAVWIQSRPGGRQLAAGAVYQTLLDFHCLPGRDAGIHEAFELAEQSVTAVVTPPGHGGWADDGIYISAVLPAGEPWWSPDPQSLEPRCITTVQATYSPTS